MMKNALIAGAVSNGIAIAQVINRPIYRTSISDVKKEIATLESALQKLSEQEEKYTAELDDALKQYADLKKQAAGMDAVELMDARLAAR